MDEKTKDLYDRAKEGFEEITKCKKIWHVSEQGAVKDLTTWKRNAGAHFLFESKEIKPQFRLPSIIKSNITPPCLNIGKQTIYFFPDLALIEDGNKFGAVRYQNLYIYAEDHRVIERRIVPSDAKIVDHTWEHPTLSGRPDKRFKSNRRIPICLYEKMHIKSRNGIKEELILSKRNLVYRFSQNLMYLDMRDDSSEF